MQTSSEEYLENQRVNEATMKLVRSAWNKAHEGGGEKYRSRHQAAGKLLPRQRVEALLDPNTPFLELCALAGTDVKGHHPGASIIGGIGWVSGIECLIIANDATVRGGAVTELGVQKTRRLAEIAEQNGLVTIQLVESSGADLTRQDRIFVPGGAGFRDLTRRSRKALTTICLVFGSCTAGGAYIPGMSDYVVMVKDRAEMYLAGPPLVKMATGEVAESSDLGGAEMHSTRSGVSDYLAEDELDAIRIGREIVSHLNWRKRSPLPAREIQPPVHDSAELIGIASADLKKPFDAREVIARVVDGSRFAEFKPLFGSTLVCGWAELFGYPVGILANNGVLFSESAQKGAQFISLCDQRNVPLLFLQNITGFMVGSEYEQAGIIKHGAHLINAVSNAGVPAITLMMGASYGAGNYAMCGRAYEPRFLFSWPNHRIAVMGGPQLAGVLDILKREQASRKGETLDETNLALVKGMIEHQIAEQSHAIYASARLWDDGVIDPKDTRSVLGLALSAACNAPIEGRLDRGIHRF